MRPSLDVAGALAPVTPSRDLFRALARVLATDELEHMVGDEDDADGLEDAADYLARTCGAAACYPLAFAELFAVLHYPLTEDADPVDVRITREMRADYVPSLAARVRPVIAEHRDFLTRQGHLALVFR